MKNLLLKIDAILMLDKPSIELNKLDLSNMSMLHQMKACPQNPVHHPEGDVWTHTMMVCDNGAIVRNRVSKDFDVQRAFMWVLFLHDVGKVTTTDEELHAYGHEIESAKYVNSLFQNENEDILDSNLVTKISALCRYHMVPRQLTRSNASKAWKKLARKLANNKSSLLELGYVTKCDSAGRGHTDLTMFDPAYEACIRYYKNIKVQAEEAEEAKFDLVNGHDLIELGFTPGPEFKKILAELASIYNNNPSLTKEDLLNTISL